jgi:hypothetical protein
MICSLGDSLDLVEENLKKVNVTALDELCGNGLGCDKSGDDKSSKQNDLITEFVLANASRLNSGRIKMSSLG